MADYMRALKWPVIAWVISDILFVVLSYVKGVAELFTPPVLALLATAFGIWGGYKIVQFKGGFVDAMGAGVVLGVACFILCYVGFGLVLGMPTEGWLPIGTFMGSLNFTGALIGGGFALTK